MIQLTRLVAIIEDDLLVRLGRPTNALHAARGSWCSIAYSSAHSRGSSACPPGTCGAPRRVLALTLSQVPQFWLALALLIIASISIEESILSLRRYTRSSACQRLSR